MILNIAIIGTGKLGTRLAEEIMSSRLTERLWLWSRSKPRLHGIVASLQMWGDMIGCPTVVDVLDWTHVSEIDIIILSLKENYDPRDLIIDGCTPSWLPKNLRYIGLERDIYGVHEVCKAIYGFQGTVVVVTNPVDVFTCLVSRWLPSAIVVGSGISLDERRCASEVGKRRGVRSANVICTLAGEHGGDLIPVPELSDDLVRKIIAEPAVFAEVIEAARIFGVNVVKDMGFTLQDAAFVMGRDVAWLEKGAHRGETRSFSFRCTEGTIGRPLRWINNDFVSIAALNSSVSRILEIEATRIERLAELAINQWLKISPPATQRK